jgi:DNA polymerase III subunit epsilon
MREIVLDTETTGLDPFQGHRVIEIGCVELVNRIPSGQTFHCYLNPERDVPAEALAVHGLTTEFLKDKPLFAEIAEDLIAFVGDAPLVIHNAAFDLGFINAELERAKRPTLARDRLIDTLLLARRKHPGGPNRLDDLCGRYGIDNSRRTKHGALLDAQILAELYLELIDARQAQLGLADANGRSAISLRARVAIRPRPNALKPRVSEKERDAHRCFVATLGATAIWSDYLIAPQEAPMTSASA